MPSPSPVPSASASQTTLSEGQVMYQTLMSAIMDLRAHLTTMTRRQDEVMQFVIDLRRELETRTRPAARASPIAPHSTSEPTSSIVEVDFAATGSTSSSPSSSQGAGPIAKASTSKPPLPIPASGRQIKRQDAFYHISNAEEAPWKAPGGHHPYHNSAYPAHGNPTPGRPASASPHSLQSPLSVSCVEFSYGNGEAVTLIPDVPMPLSQFGSTPAQVMSAPTLPPTRVTTIITQPAHNLHPRPLRREGAFNGLAQAPFRAPGPGISQPPPYPPTMAPTTPAAPTPPPKRKREDAGDTTDGDKALDRKRTRRDDVS